MNYKEEIINMIEEERGQTFEDDVAGCLKRLPLNDLLLLQTAFHQTYELGKRQQATNGYTGLGG